MGSECMLKECTEDNYFGVTVHAQRVYKGQILWGDSACSKSVQRTITMGSQCRLKECTEDNYFGVTVHAQRVYKGQILWGDSACSKSVQRTITMGSECMLKECAKDNYYAGFDTHSFHFWRKKHFNLNC